MRALRDIAAAVTMLTVVPVGWVDGARATARSVAWFPWVGLLLGGLGWAVVVAADAASVAWGSGAFVVDGSGLIAAVVLTVWAVCTRLLHWDGFADVCDAWWGGPEPGRRREIMSDSHTGAFAVIGVALAVVIQVAGLSAAIRSLTSPVWLVAVPVLGRVSVVFAAWLGVAARESGLGAMVVGRPRPAWVAIASAAVAMVIWFEWTAFGLWAIVWLALCALVAAAVPHVISARMGGVTGDVMGASVVATETIAIAVFSAWTVF